MYVKENLKYRDIYLSAGHSNVKGRDMGASGNGFVEGELTVELRDLIKRRLECMGHKVTIENNSFALRKTLAVFKNLTSTSSIVFDIHWNAATPKATGTESFVPEFPSALELKLAEGVSKECSKVLDIPLRGNFKGRRGVKSESQSRHKRLGWMRLTGHNVLLEVCFITNKGDMDSYQENKKLLAERIAKQIHLNSIIDEESKVKPKDIYEVVSGDTLSEIAYKRGLTVDKLKEMNNLTSDTIYVGQELYI